VKRIVLFFVMMITVIGASAQTFDNVNAMLSVLGSDINAAASQLTSKGYVQQNETEFDNRKVKVFTQKTTRGVHAVLVQYCGTTVTGYYLPITNPENMMLLQGLPNSGFTEGEYMQFSKGNITVKLASDHSMPNVSEQSDTYGRYKRYAYFYKTNTCHTLTDMTEDKFNFQPSSVAECLRNMSVPKDVLTTAMARSAFIKRPQTSSDKFQYVRDETAYVVANYCEGAMQGFILNVAKSEGVRLEQSLVKAGYKISEEKKGDRNAFAKKYESGDYLLVLSYTGDVDDEDDRDYAFQVGFLKKNLPCK
jgi:hypothetical protein